MKKPKIHQTEYGSLECYKGKSKVSNGRNGLSNGQLVSYMEKCKTETIPHTICQNKCQNDLNVKYIYIHIHT